MSSRWRRAALQWTAFVAEWSSVFVEGVPRGPETLVWCLHCERWLTAGECWLDVDGQIVCGTWGCTGPRSAQTSEFVRALLVATGELADKSPAHPVVAVSEG